MSFVFCFCKILLNFIKILFVGFFVIEKGVALCYTIIKNLFCTCKEIRMKILVTDDEQEIRKILRLLLEERGYTVCEASDGECAVRALREDNSIDLCIMDIMMPNLTGVEATRIIRTFSTVPILFLTARSLDKDKEEAYAEGGDDYLVKPFSSRELLMKVEALTRRYNSYTPKVEREDAIRVGGNIVIHAESREVLKNGEPIDIRDKEYDLLFFLAKHKGEVVSPQTIYENVWGEIPLPSSNNTVTVHILNLRRKLEDANTNVKIIRTVWGKGYQVD